MEIKAKTRDSNFELLRIIAMLMIVFSHAQQHGLWFAPDNKFAFNNILSGSIFRHFGIIGDLLFVFISGYFTSSTKINFKKIFRLWLQVFSTSALIGLITFFSRIKIIPYWDIDHLDVYAREGFFAATRAMNLKDLIKSFFPFYFGHYWFITAYMTFLFVCPFLNIVVLRIDQKEHKAFIMILLLIGFVIPLFPKQAFYHPSFLFPFVTGFFISKYIRLYEPKIFNNSGRNFLFAFLIFLFLCLWTFVFNLVCKNIGFGQKYIRMLIDVFIKINSLPLMICSLFIFCGFRMLKINYSAFINTIGGATFGVYLIHDNPLIHKWWWHTVFKLDRFYDSSLLIPYMVFCVVATFVICIILELTRKTLIEKPLLKLIKL